MKRKSTTVPETVTALRHLAQKEQSAASDLAFLERWKRSRLFNAATVLRAGQIMRRNPRLVRSLCAE